MADPTMAQGANLADIMKQNEELQKQLEMLRANSGAAISQKEMAQVAPPVVPQIDNKKAMLDAYKVDLAKSRGDFDKSQDAGNFYSKKAQDAEGFIDTAKEMNWGAGAAKGLGMFADTMAGMAGTKGGYTKDVMKGFEGEKKAGLDKFGSDLKRAEKAESLDPNSQESKSALMMVKEIYNKTLPPGTNAVQAKAFMDAYAKKNKMDSVEQWKQKNFDQRKEALAGPSPKELEKRAYTEKNKKPPVPSEGQATSAIHTRAMLEGEENAKAQLKKGYDPTEWTSQIGETLQKTPFVGAIARQLRSKEGVAYSDAKDGWIGAKLRKESGAAIAADEYLKENRKYFPQSGDSAEATGRKEKARKALTDQMAKNAGSALTPEQIAQVDKIYGIPDVIVPKADAEALDWLKANPNHPQADAVAKKLGLGQ